MQTLPAAAALHARNACNSLAQFAEVIREALPPDHRAQWEGLELAGAEFAVTVRWTTERRVSLKGGFVLGDAPPVGVIELEFPAPRPEIV